MIRVGTGGQLFPLQSGGNDNPSVPPSAQISWDMSALPIAIGGGGQMAYYLLGLIATFYGAVVQSGGTGVAIQPDALTAALVQAVDLKGAWHGSPLQQQFVTGAMLPIIEYLGCGYRIPRAEMFSIPAANGTYAFKRTICIPLCIGNVKKPYQTSQLALMYKKATFVLNSAAASVVSGMSPGASITGTGGTGNMTMRVSAALEPQPNLILAPGVDWIDYQTTSSATPSQQVLLNSFGNTTGLTGSNPNGGVVDLLAISGLTGAGGGSWTTDVAPGAFLPANITEYDFSWRGQYPTFHPEAIEAWAFLARGSSKQSGFGTSAAPTASDGQGFPYANNSFLQATPMAGLYGFSLVDSTEDLNISDVQTAAQNEFYRLTSSTNFLAGLHHTLARHCRSWSTPKQQDWANQVIAAGLCASVLGTNNVTSRYKPNSPQASLSMKEAQFLPIYLFNKSKTSAGDSAISGV